MKHCILIFSLSLFASLGFGQKKKDNTIIVHGFVSYAKLKDVLFDNGFMPTNTDTSIISTNYKAMGWNGEVSFMIKRTDTTTTFKGLVFAEFSGSTPLRTELENVGEKVSVFRVGFAKMSEIANSFNLPVTYHRFQK